MDILRIVPAVFLPPPGVFFREGRGRHFRIHPLLAPLGFIPGIAHAVYIIDRPELA